MHSITRLTCRPAFIQKFASILTISTDNVFMLAKLRTLLSVYTQLKC